MNQRAITGGIILAFIAFFMLMMKCDCNGPTRTAAPPTPPAPPPVVEAPPRKSETGLPEFLDSLRRKKAAPSGSPSRTETGPAKKARPEPRSTVDITTVTKDGDITTTTVKKLGGTAADIEMAEEAADKLLKKGAKKATVTVRHGRAVAEDRTADTEVRKKMNVQTSKRVKYLQERLNSYVSHLGYLKNLEAKNRSSDPDVRDYQNRQIDGQKGLIEKTQEALAQAKRELAELSE